MGPWEALAANLIVLGNVRGRRPRGSSQSKDRIRVISYVHGTVGQRVHDETRRPPVV